MIDDHLVPEMAPERALKTLIVTDNPQGLKLANELRAAYRDIDIYQSALGSFEDIARIDVGEHPQRLSQRYSVVLSLHCKQLIPMHVLTSVRCVNVHPGFNPFNRGWFPHVFSIINGLKAGVTIHEITTDIDRGPVIAQKEYAIRSWDTSETAYANIMNVERELLLEYYPSIRDGTYSTTSLSHEGNINRKRDFEELRKLDLDAFGTFRQFMDRLRAMSHGEYRNAYFVDDIGEKVFVRVVLTKDAT